MRKNKENLLGVGLLLLSGLIIPFQTNASDFGTISIANPDNPDEGITIMDRNLGATSNDIESVESYGYKYQWGNNYGFPNKECATDDLSCIFFDDSIEKDTSGAIYNDSYENNGYYSSTFIIGLDDKADYRSDGKHDGLRGGENDETNNRGATQTNYNDRKGPCPDGYHVPSIGEWGRLIKYRAEKNNVKYDGRDGYFRLLGNRDEKLSFQEYFKLPTAGYRDYGGGYILYNRETSTKVGEYRSSSPTNDHFMGDPTDKARSFGLDGKYNTSSNGSYPRAGALSIRCFKNTYESDTTENTITYPGDIQEAYDWAYENGIISESPIEDANLYDALTNSSIKKILLNFANYLGLDPNSTTTLLGDLFDDGNAFANRGTFGTALSRILRGNKYDGGNPYYKNHLEALKAAGILSQINNPESTKQIKGYTILTLMRSIDCDNADIALACFDPNNTERYKDCPMICRKIEETTYTVTINTNNENYGTVNKESTTKNIGETIKIDGNILKIGTTEIVATPQKSDSSYNYSFSNWTNNCGNELNNNCLITANFTRTAKNSGGGEEGDEGLTTSNKDNKITTDSTESSENAGDKTNNEEENKAQNQTPTEDKTIYPTNITTYEQGAQNNGDPLEILENGFTREMNNAYQFAYKNGITTMNNINDAKMDASLTRIAMAKMLSYYAINILGQKPDTSKNIQFNDVTDKQNSDYNNAVTLSYQLGIMGQGITRFRPNDEVTRAEFTTALSRMLYNTEDGKGNTRYYEPHMEKLYEEGIISNTTPSMKEKRGYVMLMLMRSAK